MSKQKMRGAFAILLSVVMLLGSVSMGVFAAETDPAYEIVASAVNAKTQEFYDTFNGKTVTLKEGESLYLVLDAVKPDGTIVMGSEQLTGFFNIKGDLKVTTPDAEETSEAFATFGWSVSELDALQDGHGFIYSYSYTAKADMDIDEEDKATDAANHLLDNLAPMATLSEQGVRGMGRGWSPDNDDVDLSRTCFEAQGGQWSAFSSTASDEYVGRAVLEFVAPADADYAIVLDSLDMIDVTSDTMFYLLKDAAENTSSTPAEGTSSTPAEGTSSTPDNTSSAPDNTSSAPACDHKDATEVADTAKAPTCTEKGQKADKVCPDCEETIKGEEIAALGHDFGEDNDEPLCSVCKARNEDYVYVPSGPYYKEAACKYISMSATREADMPADADMADYEFSDGKYYSLAISEKVTLKKGEIAYIVIDPTDEEGNLRDYADLEWYMHIFDTTGLEVATFQREQSGGLGIGREQNEHGLTFAYSYTDAVNWTNDTAEKLLLDNYTELVYTSINEAPQFKMTTCWVAPEGKPGEDMQVGVINSHGRALAESNDSYVTRMVLAFEAPVDDEYTINAFAAGNATVHILQTAEAPVDPTPDNSKPDSNKPGSPTTGVDTFVWPVALVALVTMAAGVVLCTKKSRAK